MDHIIYLFAAVILLGAVLASISIWAPRRVWIKVCAVGATALFAVATYAGFTDMLSKPKPVDLEWALRQVEEATVLGARAAEDQGIYIWLEFRDVPEPRAYVLPWDIKTAQQLQEAMREAQTNGNGLRMRRPFDGSTTEYEEPRFYAPPQQRRPDKIPEAGVPQAYHHPDRST